MAWNPIQLGRIGTGAATDGLADLIMRRRQEERDYELHRSRMLLDANYRQQESARQMSADARAMAGEVASRERDEAEQKRLQSREDRALRGEKFQARQRAAELIRQGRVNEAQSLLSVYDLNLQDAMPGPGDTADMSPLAMGGSAVSDSLDGGRSMQAMAPGDLNASGVSPGFRTAHSGMDGTDDIYGPAPSGPGINPFIAARQADIERDRRRAEMLKSGGRLAPAATGPTPGTPAASSSGAGPLYRVTGPGGEAFDLDPYESERFQVSQREKQLGQMDTAFAKVEDDPVVAKYWPRVRAAIEAGTLKPEEGLETMLRFQQADDSRETRLAAVDARKRRGGGVGAPKPPKPATEGQSRANAFLTVMAEEARAIESLPPLSPEGRKVLFEELALRNAADKNPALDLTARLTGVRKTVEQQLHGTDRQAYSAYLSFLDPLVRQRTGANAPPSEVAALAAPIMPGLGDGPDDFASKKKRRRTVLESMAAQSNQGDVWRAKIGAIYGDAAPTAPTGGVAGWASTTSKPKPPAQRARDLERVNQALAAPGLSPEKRAKLEALKARIEASGR